MLKRLKQGCIFALVAAPDFIWNVADFLLAKRVPQEYLQELRMQHYARYLLKHFDKEWKKAAENRKCMVIQKVPFSYSYCNVSVINNMLSLIIYALYRGCIPVIKFNENNPEYFRWGWYFEQPYEIMKTDITGFGEIECDVVAGLLHMDMQLLHTPNDWKCKLYKLLYRKFIKFNQETQSYIENEISAIGDPGQMLGVLIRGTDYVQLKPAGHPVQPTPEEIVQKVQEYFSSGAYTAVYVATEERRLYNMVGSAIGMHNLRENKRVYYDDIYYGNGIDLIGKVRFDRDNDNYWKGLEYLSSLTILSRCRTLVAGNCGGTVFAMMMADYDKPMIFNYGVY